MLSELHKQDLEKHFRLVAILDNLLVLFPAGSVNLVTVLFNFATQFFFLKSAVLKEISLNLFSTVYFACHCTYKSSGLLAAW